MESNGLTVAGRKFRIRAEYEAALRDEKKIQKLREQFDFTNQEDVKKLYREMQAGNHIFESMVGNDFDDEVFDLKEKLESQPSPGKDIPKKQWVSGKKSKSKEPSGNGEMPEENLDSEMRQEILAVLRKKEKKRKALAAGCSILAIASFVYLGIYYFFAERTDREMEQLAGLKNKDVLAGMSQNTVRVHKTGETELPDVLEEYISLYNKNKKLIGWLKIADTNIDYPVMQTVNNEYYLDHNVNQGYDKNGSIFMDYRCSLYPRNTNLILYGHHMKSGKMFGALQNYAKESYYKEHAVIEFDTIYEKGTYEILYVFYSKIYTENEIRFKYYQFFDANSKEEFDSNMKEMANMSLYNTGVTAQYGDQLLTLSTCDDSQSDGRFVVVAKRVS